MSATSWMNANLETQAYCVSDAIRATCGWRCASRRERA